MPPNAPPPGWASPGRPTPAPKTPPGLVAIVVLGAIALAALLGLVVLDGDGSGDGSGNPGGSALAGANQASTTTQPAASGNFGEGVEDRPDQDESPSDDVDGPEEDEEGPTPAGDPEAVVVQMLTTPDCEETAELVARDSLDSYWASCVEGVAESDPVTELRSETDTQATVVVTRVAAGEAETSDVTLIAEDGAWRISYWATDGSTLIEPS